MKTVMKCLAVAVLALAIGLMTTGDADAKRFGGGRSFGGSKSFSKSYSKPTSPQRQSGAGQQAAARPGSRFGGMGGLFGGLLAGTLLGSLFFGHPFAGGGMMDILLIGGLIFLLMKFFKGRRPATQAAGRTGGMGYGGAGPDVQSGPSQRSAGAAAGWGGLSSQGSSAAQGPSIDVPAGFDEKEFLEGAKTLFTRMQTSWDARDIDDISQFATEAVVAEVRAQAQADPGPSRTEVLMVDARLLEAKVEGPATLATVFFDAFLREDDASGGSGQVREVWHFRKDDAVSGGMWLLDGIQQLDN